MEANCCGVNQSCTRLQPLVKHTDLLATHVQEAKRRNELLDAEIEQEKARFVHCIPDAL